MKMLEGVALQLAASDYLKNTDFFVLRELSGGVPIPEKVRKRRAEAVALVDRSEFKAMLDELFYTDEDIVTAFSRVAQQREQKNIEAKAAAEAYFEALESEATTNND